jgi:hypothetical protein
VRALSLQLKRKQRKSFASSNVESNKLKQQPKLRVTHKLRSGEVFTGACGGCIIAAQATVKGSRGGGSTISLKTVARAAPNLQIAAPLFVQARYIMMTIPSSQVTSPNATPPVRLNSSTIQMMRGMATMISWVKLHAAVSKAANLKNLASRRVDLAALAADTIPAMTLAEAVTTRANPEAASVAPNVSREDASTIHASQRSARRVKKKKSSSLRRRRAAVRALTAPQLHPPNQSALLLLRLLKRSLRRRLLRLSRKSLF